MNATDWWLLQMNEAQWMLELVIGDVTAEMLAWTPSDYVRPIGAIYAHAVGLEDLYIHQILQGKPLLWETGQWRTKLGHEVAPNQWNLQNLLPRDLAAFNEYQQTIFKNSRAYVRGLSTDDFDRVISFPGRAWSMSVAQLLATTIAHTTSHAGEIAMLKGLQGAQGLPY